MMKHKHYLADMSWPEFQDRLEEVGRIVCIPITATEQHGLYYPLRTDWDMIEGWMKRAEELYDDIIYSPLIPFNTAISLEGAYPGTLAVRIETLINLYTDICECLIRQGTQKIVWLIGCEGTVEPSRVVSQRLRDKYGTLFVGIDIFFVLHEAGILPPGGSPGRLVEGHAGVREGSICLANLSEEMREDVARRHRGNSYVAKGTKIPWGTDNMIDPRLDPLGGVAATLTTSKVGERPLSICFWGGEWQDFDPPGFITEDFSQHNVEFGKQAIEICAQHFVNVLKEIRKIKVPIEDPKPSRKGTTYSA